MYTLLWSLRILYSGPYIYSTLHFLCILYSDPYVYSTLVPTYTLLSTFYVYSTLIPTYTLLWSLRILLTLVPTYTLLSTFSSGSQKVLDQVIQFLPHFCIIYIYILPWHLLGHAIMSVISFDLQFSCRTRPMTSFCIFIAYINTEGILFNFKITRWD